ncbi:DUF2306 domain-containing protein [Asticcacaulis sp. YBE204]|uniref:DUF2306 domain-containing protein n=1 Tax=Asticcacaulis sp. YBE204 TaxID=1282363 RepID=UPI0003C3EFB0|nr:DUF2306 domain-containing protein [Asticcacaulis sp. YBE204]ESQ81046.1 hypothetical protein AEYBE204_01590 [Asticcacaulis sp. YBE204]
MATTVPGKFNYLRSFIAAVLLTVAVIGIAVWMTGGDLSRIGEVVAQSRLHTPHLNLIAQSSLATQIHLSAACLAFLIGLYQLMGPKGRTPHRVLGYIWLALMLTAAISSFWLKGLNHGAYSFIHILSGWTVVVAPMILYSARTKNIKRHRNMATGLFMGGLVVAGLFAFIPGRLMWQVFFG